MLQEQEFQAEWAAPFESWELIWILWQTQCILLTEELVSHSAMCIFKNCSWNKGPGKWELEFQMLSSANRDIHVVVCQVLVIIVYKLEVTAHVFMLSIQKAKKGRSVWAICGDSISKGIWSSMYARQRHLRRWSRTRAYSAWWFEEAHPLFPS